MAKDPRFNFYPDNWEGGTDGFTLEQEGAYLALIILQSRKGAFTSQQAMDKLLQKTRGNAAASAGLWEFLMPKFETDGKLFWSGRMKKEMEKSSTHSKKQSERANKRWSNKRQDAAASACNGTGTGNGIETKEFKYVSAEKNDSATEEDYSFWTDQIIDGNDQYFQTMLMNEQIPISENISFWVLDHRGLLSRYPSMRPATQQSFRNSCLKHVRENYKKQINGVRQQSGNKKQQQSSSTADYLANHYAEKLNGNKQKPQGATGG
jgi:uncharacterized protein YdaU (DUF1376 family)